MAFPGVSRLSTPFRVFSPTRATSKISEQTASSLLLVAPSLLIGPTCSVATPLNSAITLKSLGGIAAQLQTVSGNYLRFLLLLSRMRITRGS